MVGTGGQNDGEGEYGEEEAGEGEEGREWRRRGRRDVEPFA